MKNPNSLVFLVFLSSLCALPPLAIDMALPAVRAMTADLRTTPGATGLTLSLFMAGFAVTPILYGPLSDRFGRRPILLAGITIFTGASFFAAAATNISALLFARFAEGAGAGAGMAMAFAIVRDSFEGSAARSKLAYAGMVTSVAPMIAPSIGAILLFAGWRMIYLALALNGAALLATVVFGFKESHSGQRKVGGLFGHVVSGYRIMFSSRIGLGYALVYAGSFGVQFSYIAGSPLVFVEHFGLSPRFYGLIFACTAAGTMAGAYTNTQIARRGVAGHVPLVLGVAIYLLTALLILGLLAVGHAGIGVLACLLVLSAYGFGLIAANASHGALHALPQIAGIAASVLTSLQMCAAVIASAVVAASYSGLGITGMVLSMLSFSLLSAGFYFFMVRPAERRLHPQNVFAVINPDLN